LFDAGFHDCSIQVAVDRWPGTARTPGMLVWFDEGASFRKAPGGGKKIRGRW